MKITHKTRVVVQFLIPLAFTYAALVSFFISTLPWNLNTLVKSLVGGGVVAMALALLQDIIPKPIKEAIIFLRAKDRLPGHRCFDPRRDNPSRFNRSKIKNIAALSRAEPATQQIAFYSLYQKVSKNPSVQHYSMRYLAWRDTAVVSLLLGSVTIPVLGLSAESFWPASKVMLIMFLIALASMLAARQAAHELVFQVLALNTTR